MHTLQSQRTALVASLESPGKWRELVVVSISRGPEEKKGEDDVSSVCSTLGEPEPFLDEEASGGAEAVRGARESYAAFRAGAIDRRMSAADVAHVEALSEALGARRRAAEKVAALERALGEVATVSVREEPALPKPTGPPGFTRYAFTTGAVSPTEVLACRGAVADLGACGADLVPPSSASSRLFVVTDATTSAAYGASVLACLERLGYVACSLALPDGDKRLDAYAAAADDVLCRGMDKGSAILALGGCDVCDVAGLLASTLHRGVGLIVIPTTLSALARATSGAPWRVDTGPFRDAMGFAYAPNKIVVDVDVLGAAPLDADAVARCLAVALDRRDDVLLRHLVDGDAAGAAGRLASTAASDDDADGGGTVIRGLASALRGAAPTLGRGASLSLALAASGALDEPRIARLCEGVGLPLAHPDLDVDAVVAAFGRGQRRGDDLEEPSEAVLRAALRRLVPDAPPPPAEPPAPVELPAPVEAPEAPVEARGWSYPLSNNAQGICLVFGLLVASASTSAFDVDGASVTLKHLAGLYALADVVRRSYHEYLEWAFYTFPEQRTQKDYAPTEFRDETGRTRDELELIEYHDRLTGLSTFALFVGAYATLGRHLYPDVPLPAAVPAGAAPAYWLLRVVAHHYCFSFAMYWAHRYCHVNRFLWKHVHSLHHFAKTPLARATYMDHWFDNFFNAVLCEVCAPILVPLPFGLLAASRLFRICESLEKHSGLSGALNVVHTAQQLLPFAQMPHHHDWHHEGHKGSNYTFASLGGLWDVLFMTRHHGRADGHAKVAATRHDEHLIARGDLGTHKTKPWINFDHPHITPLPLLVYFAATLHALRVN